MRLASPASSPRSPFKVIHRRALPSAGATKRLLRLFLQMSPEAQASFIGIGERFVRRRGDDVASKLQLVDHASASTHR